MKRKKKETKMRDLSIINFITHKTHVHMKQKWNKNWDSRDKTTARGKN